MRKDGVQRQFGECTIKQASFWLLGLKPSVSVWVCPSDLYKSIERFQARDSFGEIYDGTFRGILLIKSRTPNSAEC